MKSIAKSIYKHLFTLYNILTEGGENMKLTLRYNITKIDKKQKEIIEEIMWHATKVYNMVLYELREGKRKIDVNKSINIIQTEIYKEERKGTNIMSIDIGINNIVACTNKENSKSMLVSGREAKSKNKYIQEKIRKLQQINKKAKENREKEKVKNTKRIEKMWKYRKNYMNTYMHKVSKMVIEYAKENKCVEIVIGDLKRIKEGMKGNKSFVQMPLKELVRKIEYKAKLEGIKVNKVGEEYTSGVSAIDKEEIKKENYNKKRRISRGIYISKEGKKINADINGSLNILRKYIKKSSPNQEIAMDNGREQRPLKKRVA